MRTRANLANPTLLVAAGPGLEFAQLLRALVYVSGTRSLARAPGTRLKCKPYQGDYVSCGLPLAR